MYNISGYIIRYMGVFNSNKIYRFIGNMYEVWWFFIQFYYQYKIKDEGNKIK